MRLTVRPGSGRGRVCSHDRDHCEEKGHGCPKRRGQGRSSCPSRGSHQEVHFQEVLVRIGVLKTQEAK